MATDFDFDTEFNDTDDQEGFDDVEEEEGEKKSRPNILRIVLLVLFILVLLCVVCGYLANSGIIPIPGLGGSEPAPPPPVQETPAPEATDVGEVPQPTEQPPVEETVDQTQPEATAPTEEQPSEATEETPATEEAPAPEATATEGPTVVITTEPVETPTETPGETPTPEPTATSAPPTNTAVPGPTPTSGPTVVITITPDICNNNIPPVADAGGPYNAMRGKGQAIVNFDGTSSTDPDGEIVSYEWDFGDGSDFGSGATVSHGYTDIGTYSAILTVTDNCDATGQDTADVTIVGPTPPATATVTGTPPITTTPTAAPPPTATPDASATMGFCYRVQYGDTLSGIAWKFGVPWQELATVNQVPMGYFVIAGQGLFIPTEPAGQGPNMYQVIPGDTMYGVAYDCGLSASTLVQANGLSPTDSLTPGQTLIIPLWRP